MRYVKPTFWTDSRMVRLSRDARLFYIGTWNFALCDKGHIEDDPIQLKMQIFPADNVDVQALMDELIAAGRLVRVTDGTETWLQIATLEAHQKTDPRWTPRCPACKTSGNLSETLQSLGEPPASADEPTDPPEGDESQEPLPNSPQEGRGGEGIGEKPPVVPHAENGNGPKSKPTTDRKRPAKPIPEDWQPNETHVAKAKELGVDGRREEEKFRAHAEATDRRQVNWNAAFTQWLLNAKPASNVRPLQRDTTPRPANRPAPEGPFQYRPARPGEENRLR